MDPKTKAILELTQKVVNEAKEEMRRRRNDEDRKYILAALSKDLMILLEPFLEKIAINSQIAKEEFKEIIKEIKVESPKVTVGSPQVEVKSPPINIPPIVFPKKEMMEAIRQAMAGIKVESPNVEVKAPEVKVPGKMEVKGLAGYFRTLIQALAGKFNVGLEEIDRDNPLHVILVDKKGKYYAPPGGGITMGRGGGETNIEEIDLTSQLDGSATTFNLGRTVKSIILVNLNGTLAPYTLNTSKNQITLTIAPDSGEKLEAIAII